MTKILLITDAWFPQVNGVVTTLSNLVEQAKSNGHFIDVFHPGLCVLGFPLPTYKEIRVGIPMPWTVSNKINEGWDCIHIATPEGSLGMTFAKKCRKLNIPFSTSCHTKFPEFVNAKFPFISTDLGWKFMRHVYKDSTKILTTTDTMVQELKDKGFTQDISSWTRGVNRKYFSPIENPTGGYIVCVSRVSHEKGLDDFCKINYPRKIVVGDGPYRKELERKYPDVEFVGTKKGHELASYYSNADCFVFPSRNDTFGVVIIESLATGTPVASYPVTGPIDILNKDNGSMKEDLNDAVQECLKLDRKKVYKSSLKWSWEECYKQFFQALIKFSK
jgi:glycosyltransferase involved in cell wall biosynthesis